MIGGRGRLFINCAEAERGGFIQDLWQRWGGGGSMRP